MTQQFLFVLSLLLSTTFAGWIPALKLIRYIRARKQKQQQRGTQGTIYYAQIGDKVYVAPLPGPAYEVNSPEFNAQVVGMIRELNKRLANKEKHIPVQIIADNVRQISGDQNLPQ